MGGLRAFSALLLPTFVVFGVSTAWASSSSWGHKSNAGPFGAPQDVAFSRTDAWITDPADNTVVEIDAATGRPVRTVHGTQGRFNTPVPIAADSTDVWVDGEGSAFGNTIAELSSSIGGYVRSLRREPPQAQGGGALAVCDGHLWSVGVSGYYEYSVASGKLQRVVDLSKKGIWFGGGGEVSVEGNDLWDTGVKGRANVAVELSCSTSSVLKVLDVGNSAEDVGGIAVSGDRLWSLSGAGTLASNVTVREFNTTTGALVRVNRYRTKYDLAVGPIAASGNVLCILSQGGARVALVNGSTGSLIKMVSSALFSPEIQFVAADGGDFWLLDTEGSTVDVLSAKTGRIVHYIGPTGGPRCTNPAGCGG
jgi:DNA-binding beta-propeller fold protein YncE